MATPNQPDPEKIPDMSLGERGDKPSAATPIPPWELPSSYQAEPANAAAAPTQKKPEPPVAPNWREGDAVLAPWEPMFLYPGRIRQILADEAKGDQALIAFDDGGEGWVYLYSLCPYEIKNGQEVEVRRRNGTQYFAGEIVEVGDEDVRVRYGEGDVEWAPIFTIRVPCIENGPGASATRLAPWQPQYPTDQGGGVPSWVYTVGVIVLVIFLRIGCRAMTN